MNLEKALKRGNDEPEKKFRLDPEDGLVDKDGDPVYCSAGGCEAQAWELVGEGQMPLCGVCADVWYMGFEAGWKEAGKDES